jgi:hypothetical protein
MASLGWKGLKPLTITSGEMHAIMIRIDQIINLYFLVCECAFEPMNIHNFLHQWC